MKKSTAQSIGVAALGAAIAVTAAGQAHAAHGEAKDPVGSTLDRLSAAAPDLSLGGAADMVPATAATSLGAGMYALGEAVQGAAEHGAGQGMMEGAAQNMAESNPAAGSGGLGGIPMQGSSPSLLGGLPIG
ncbi:ATP-binding protein [Streptomyces sp. ST2-7A]|uniref:ATP-binding protein n=1 Tax=Streptomyces sp. ST2-7A TaxID=2907214 RepID=UPI001F3020B5|nr:ATP-binding protein [Streptomyces sp. ST2-7A]MCE7078620.1 ATP-binding protein [Streptomyces sp. ST2-7A]